VETRAEQLAHLQRLIDALDPHALTAGLVIGSRPYAHVANASTPTLNERVYCDHAADGSWTFQWPWRQPIGSVDDLEMVAGKVAEVLRCPRVAAFLCPVADVLAVCPR
jgi:hypothetical protein